MYEHTTTVHAYNCKIRCESETHSLEKLGLEVPEVKTIATHYIDIHLSLINQQPRILYYHNYVHAYKITGVK